MLLAKDSPQTVHWPGFVRTRGGAYSRPLASFSWVKGVALYRSKREEERERKMKSRRNGEKKKSGRTEETEDFINSSQPRDTKETWSGTADFYARRSKN